MSPLKRQCQNASATIAGCANEKDFRERTSRFEERKTFASPSMVTTSNRDGLPEHWIYFDTAVVLPLWKYYQFDA